MQPSEVCAGDLCVPNPFDPVIEAVGFMSDPFGYLFDRAQSAAVWFTQSVLPQMVELTQPDLTAEWFGRAYAVSFALAIIVMGLLVLPEIVATARGTQAGAELFDLIMMRLPVFFVGAMFGPAFGVILIEFFEAISIGLAQWGVGTSTQEVIATLESVVSNRDIAGTAGGMVIGYWLLLAMVVGLLLMTLAFFGQLVALYFTGVIFPVCWVWTLRVPTRERGIRAAYLWVSILTLKPLIFLMLGVAYALISSQSAWLTSAPDVQQFASLLVTLIAFVLAGYFPMKLMKFAATMPLVGGRSHDPTPGQTIGAGSLSRWAQPSSSAPPRASAPSSPGASGQSSSGRPGSAAPPRTPSQSAPTPRTPSQSAPTATKGAATKGAATKGAATKGAATKGAATKGAATKGAAQAATKGAAVATGVGTAVVAADIARQVPGRLADLAVAPMDEAHGGEGVGER